MWNKLSMQDKAKVMKMAVESGLTDLDSIKGIYNKFAEGGDTEPSNEAKLNYLLGRYNLDTEEYFLNTKLEKDKRYIDFLKSSSKDLDDIYSSSVINDSNKDSSYIYAPYGGIEAIGYAPLQLDTYYPIVHPWYDSKKDSDYKWTGHSSLNSHDREYSGYFDDPDYNLVTNNCSDETRMALEAIFEDKMDNVLFTTPGDVRDFAIKHGGIKRDPLGRTITIPMDKEKYARLREYDEDYSKRKKIMSLNKQEEEYNNMIGPAYGGALGEVFGGVGMRTYPFNKLHK